MPRMPSHSSSTFSKAFAKVISIVASRRCGATGVFRSPFAGLRTSWGQWMLPNSWSVPTTIG
jgi:hypothetical protein